MPSGEIMEVSLDKLSVGDQVIVKLGEKVLVDGEIVSGSTSIDESMLTGESKPVFKKEGDEVIGGSIMVMYPAQ